MSLYTTPHVCSNNIPQLNVIIHRKWLTGKNILKSSGKYSINTSMTTVNTGRSEPHKIT